ncbi:MAG: DUF1015 domain-containing protein [Bacillota bacterium]|jgi:uncharacterized protein (DUF1015 family)
MADVKAFCALRYNPEKTADLSKVITPPYDVINAAMQDDLYHASPYNIIRLEWGKIFDSDHENDNRYIRAKEFFEKWQQDDILKQDPKPAFYLYKQEFQILGQNIVRSGFMATIKAEGYDSGQVLPHEETLPKHKVDRLQLMRHTFANFSPIFGLFAQESRNIDHALARGSNNKAPDIDITDGDGVRHLLWVVDDADITAEIEKDFQNLHVYIADGHHRYETASAFAKECREKGLDGCDHMMIALVNLYDPGLVVLPTHRMVKNLPDFQKADFLNKLQAAGFTLEEIAASNKEQALKTILQQIAANGKEKPSFGLYFPEQFYVISLLDKKSAIAKIRPDKSAAYRQLDVSILHSLILEDLLGIGAKELAEEGWIGYTREDQEALDKVDSGEYLFSFLMNSTAVQELLDVAEAGDKMPQKSTFFYPKMIAGLTVNKLK